MTGSVYAMVPGDGGPREGFKAHHHTLLNLTPEQKNQAPGLEGEFPERNGVSTQ